MWIEEEARTRMVARWKTRLFLARQRSRSKCLDFLETKWRLFAVLGLQINITDFAKCLPSSNSLFRLYALGSHSFRFLFTHLKGSNTQATLHFFTRLTHSIPRNLPSFDRPQSVRVSSIDWFNLQKRLKSVLPPVRIPLVGQEGGD